MLKNTFRTLVQAQAETIWGLLAEGMEHPGKYRQGVEEAKIVERFDDGVLRELRYRGKLFRERLVADRKGHELRCELVEHPLFTGSMVAKLAQTSVQNPMAPVYLEYIIDFERRSFQLEGVLQAEEELAADIRGEMAFLKGKAEELEKRG
ncbi:hypothetical protein [Geobacter sp.]|uniref:hypothetical protein n=1 Tax=Geobacter sp. TaxID=46610 RepID=UPI00260753C7|nr:hypothetical protein [Geobacter sp.]